MKDKLFEDPGISKYDIFLIEKENERQLEKWGIQRVRLFEWLTYLVEEVGELADAIIKYTYRDGTPEEIMEEAVQAATLALKIAKMAEGVKE